MKGVVTCFREGFNLCRRNLNFGGNFLTTLKSYTEKTISPNWENSASLPIW